MLTSSQLNALGTSQLIAFTTSQFIALATSNFSALTSTAVGAFTSTQVAAMTSTQLGAISTSQTGLLHLTPIVLDLIGKGIQTTSINNGVNFDLLGNGQIEKTGWIEEGEGLLMFNPNGASSLNDGSQLFGQGTNLVNGKKAVDGYEALSALDTNQDGVINSQDAAFNQLGVWIDTGNSNGSATGSFESLSQLGITQLNLNAKASTEVNNGNHIGLISSFETASGATGQMADVWFTAQVAPGASSTVTTSSMSANVSGLASALNSFNQNAGVSLSTSVNQNLSGFSTAPTGLLSARSISSLSALSQFNSNGQPISATSASSAPISVTLNTSGIIPNGSATLAVPNLKKSS